MRPSFPLAKLQPYYSFQNYDIFNVFENTTPEIRALIRDLWERNKALPLSIDPDARARQAALLAVRQDGEMVGVSTVFQDHLLQKRLDGGDFNENIYVYRMFVQPSDYVPELSRFIMNGTYDMLQSLSMADKPESMVIICENEKLMLPGVQRRFQRYGYKKIGQNAVGQDIMRRAF